MRNVIVCLVASGFLLVCFGFRAWSESTPSPRGAREPQEPQTRISLLDESQPTPKSKSGVMPASLDYNGTALFGSDGDLIKKDDINKIVANTEAEDGVKTIVIVLLTPEKVSSLDLGKLVDRASSGLKKGEELHVIIKMKGLRNLLPPE
jgi:hypothetical protein